MKKKQTNKQKKNLCLQLLVLAAFGHFETETCSSVGGK